MRSIRRRGQRDGFFVLIVVGFRVDDRPAGFLIDTFCPCDLRKRLSRNERSREAIENIVKTVLVRLHENLSLPAIDRQVREYESLDAVIIPGIAGNRLVIPFQLARVGSDGQDRTHKQVVFAFGLPQLFRPWTTVAGSDVNEIRVGIIGHTVPDRSTAPEFPPLSGPRLGRLFQRRILERFRRIARNRVEPPCELAGVGIVCCKKSADRKLGTAHADNDFAFCDARGHGDRVVVLRICDARFPNRLTRFCIQSLEPAIDYGRDDLPQINSNAAIHNTATDLGPDSGLINFRIPPPSFLPRAGIDGEDDAPVCDAAQTAIPEKRSCFLIAASLSDVIRPGQTKPAHVGGIDLFQGAVAGLARSETVGQPFLARPAGIPQCHIIEPARLLGYGTPHGEEYPAKRKKEHDQLSSAHRLPPTEASQTTQPDQPSPLRETAPGRVARALPETPRGSGRPVIPSDQGQSLSRRTCSDAAYPAACRALNNTRLPVCSFLPRICRIAC